MHFNRVQCHYNVLQYDTDIAYGTTVISEHQFQLKKDTPYCILTGELWGVNCECFGEHCIISLTAPALYLKSFPVGTRYQYLFILYFQKSGPAVSDKGRYIPQYKPV